MKHLYLLCIAVAIALFTNGQEATYTMTEPLDISKAGWNKVLQMKNGNTMLFHFEPRKSILVKVFDKDHKEIATKKHPCDLIDINAFERSIFDGLVEINNEAVMLQSA